jgi:hypothetical protein
VGAYSAKSPSWWDNVVLNNTTATKPGGHFSGEA